MKLLIVTQKLDKNDDVLGFFHEWAREFAKKVDSLTIIALGVGEHDLPKNVRVFSLGKEQGSSKLSRVFRFYKLAISNLRSYDRVFVHMNPEYIIIAWPIWVLLGKKISLWYTHKHVSLRLRIAHVFCTNIFSVSKESFRLPSKKLHVMGHGISTEVLVPATQKNPNMPLSIVTIGRLSPTKRPEVLIEAVAIARAKFPEIRLNIVGAPGTPEQQAYYEKLKALVAEKGIQKNVVFQGSVPHKDILKHLQSADIFVNLSGTGSVDKAVLEAMSAGVIVLTSNEAFKPILEGLEPNLIVTNDAAALATSIGGIATLDISEKQKLGQCLRSIVVRDHNLHSLIGRLVTLMAQ